MRGRGVGGGGGRGSSARGENNARVERDVTGYCSNLLSLAYLDQPRDHIAQS